MRKRPKQFLLTPLCEGRPTITGKTEMAATNFYSRPSARGDIIPETVEAASRQFLLTPLCEGRLLLIGEPSGFADFYSRPSARGDPKCENDRGGIPISTHAPLRGATFNPAACISATEHFYSRPSARGDLFIQLFTEIYKFLLTPLCEGRLAIAAAHKAATAFLLTPLCEGRPEVILRSLRIVGISTHAPLRGATINLFSYSLKYANFYSRPSARGDGEVAYPINYGWKISTHAPLRGATRRHMNRNSNGRFLLTPLCEGRLAGAITGEGFQKFLLTPLCEGRHRKLSKCTLTFMISTHAPLRGATR